MSVHSRMRTFVLSIALVLVASFAAAQDYGGYRPHYQGYGVNTPGGRGGTICRVTSLSDEAWPFAPGTLRHCVETVSGPRIVIFEVSGTIRLIHGPLTVRQPYLTIAGQSAPSPGILIRGPGVIIDTHDVVLQHLRIRVGNVWWEPHGLWFRDNATNAVADHISVSWSVWTSVGIVPYTPGATSGDVTIMDSIVAEALACSGVNTYIPCDPAGFPGNGYYTNSRGMLIGNTSRVTLLRNLLANSNDRHPEINGRTRTILVNNMIYNPSLIPWSAIFYADGWNEGPLYSVAANNLLVPGPTTPGHNGYVPIEYPEEREVTMFRINETVDPNSQIYLTGNYYAPHCGGGSACLSSPSAQWRLAKDWGGPSVHAASPPLQLSNLPLSSAMPYNEVEGFLTANAGARPLDRDVVDERIIGEVLSRSGSVPNHTSEKAGYGTEWDGFPILAENRRALTVPSNPHQVVDGVGRTRVEQWLEDMARELEPASGGSGSGSDLPVESAAPAASGSPRWIY